MKLTHSFTPFGVCSLAAMSVRSIPRRTKWMEHGHNRAARAPVHTEPTSRARSMLCKLSNSSASCANFTAADQGQLSPEAGTGGCRGLRTDDPFGEGFADGAKWAAGPIDFIAPEMWKDADTDVVPGCDLRVEQAVETVNEVGSVTGFKGKLGLLVRKRPPC